MSKAASPDPAPARAAPPVPDSARETRRRLLIGLAGLVLMLLLVMLAGIVTEQVRRERDLATAQAEAAGVENPGETGEAVPSPTEPLGDVAADPDAAPLVTAPTAVVPGADGTVTVPDLQPDPQLEAAKNRR